MKERGILTEYPSRIDALKNRYFIIKAQINKAQKQVSIDDYYVTKLKKQKLILKEQIEGIRKVS
ncbi:MAG: DUF465 domain-containing protein [Alphaproteobacteria bacterium]|nr:DUF465 domain-containing protein [Alphaproteobacteria bacterium]